MSDYPLDLSTPCILDPRPYPNGWGRYRAAWKRAYGVLPRPLWLDHVCMTPACINVLHLEPVAPGENTRRARAHITQCPQGHAYDEANTIWEGTSRTCRTCRRARQRAAMHKLRLTRKA